MLAEAKREAERIVKEARERQAQLVSEQEVTKQAERAAEDIIEDARAREREIRLGAEDYADEILNTLEVNLSKFIAAVQRGRERLQGRGEEALADQLPGRRHSEGAAALGAQVQPEPDVGHPAAARSRAVAELAESYELNVAPHNYYSHLSTLHSAHLCACVPNVRIMEIDIDDVPWKDELVDRPPVIEQGELVIPTRPGWGAELNEAVARKHVWEPGRLPGYTDATRAKR